MVSLDEMKAVAPLYRMFSIKPYRNTDVVSRFLSLFVSLRYWRRVDFWGKIL
jgi:hypothetical protein